MRMLMAICLLIGGGMALFMVHVTWGTVPLLEWFLLAIFTLLVSLLEKSLFRYYWDTTLLPVWILGVGLLFSPATLIPMGVGRGLALLFTRDISTHAAYQWGRDFLTYMVGFLLLAYLGGGPHTTWGGELERAWLAFLAVLPAAELFGSWAWEVTRGTPIVSLRPIAAKLVMAVLAAFAAPLFAKLFLGAGAVWVAVAAVFLYGEVFLVLWFVDTGRHARQNATLTKIVRHVVGSLSWEAALQATLELLQPVLRGETLFLCTLPEGADELHLECSVGEMDRWDEWRVPVGGISWREVADREVGLSRCVRDVASSRRADREVGLSRYVRDVASSRRADKRSLSEQPVVTMLGGQEVARVPIVVAQRCIGFLFVVRSPWRADEASDGLLNHPSLGAALGTLLQLALFQTEKRQIEARTNQLLENLRQFKSHVVQSSKITGIGHMAAGVSHEINNPIGAILANAQFLEMRPLGPDERESVENIVAAARRCRDITGKLLHYARGEVEEFVELNLNEIVENTVSMLKYGFSREGVRLEEDLDPLMPVWGSTSELSQVVTNLLVNAKDAVLLRANAGDRLVQARTRIVGGFVVLEVEDNGIGMSEETAQKVFQPFFTTKDVGKGTGMGLSICQGIVEVHNGRIEVKSVRGRGSVFRVRLPVGKQKRRATTAGIDEFHF